MPPLMSTSSSEAKEDWGQENQGNDRGEQPTIEEVDGRRFRINRREMAQHLERFRLTGRRTNKVWTTRTKLESSESCETEKELSKASTTSTHEQQGRSQDDQTTKSGNQPGTTDK
ncbi:hypothetical protein SARC_04060 [Sphaeroforma arctica JP610]|uniref:Uncharacterized protein n=1 Tax=Sphaeroforma arctica JP610 TaxID=667725 RepID=A0A0L0G4G0_9EUKA|nr:hypothetical protein SARC_04060 [Sphaeroforma arctica JP610]KNC83701.1 hypothetical protein SARC_04060 [Sphaeroforma arctica JP610]|eukprot:XP_014157603.1 hypothetical protein SARC_04060 [Sphaeroforma arctica JP610]